MLALESLINLETEQFSLTWLANEVESDEVEKAEKAVNDVEPGAQKRKCVYVHVCVHV